MFILFGRWHFGRKAVGYERIQEIEDPPRHEPTSANTSVFNPCESV